MSKNGIINFNSPWPEILDAARQPMPLQTQLRRGPLTQEEVESLSGVKTLLLNLKDYPPAKDDSPESTGVFAKDLSAKIMQSGWPYAPLYQNLRPEDVNIGASFALIFDVAFSHPKAPRMRSAPQYSNDFTLDTPSAHRLRGEVVPALAVVIFRDSEKVGAAFNPRKYLRQIPKADDEIIAQIHEFTHLVQLRPKGQFDRLVVRLEQETDADNNALIGYQKVFGGSPTVAANTICGRVVDPFIGSTANYQIWPGQTVQERYAAPMVTGGLKVSGLYTALALPQPSPEAIFSFALVNAGIFPPRDKWETMRSEVEKISNIIDAVNELHGDEGVMAATFWGMARFLQTKGAQKLSPTAKKLGRMAVEAAEIVAPHWLHQRPKAAVIPD